jgi:autotransporter translocation and assembly factor TamB
MTLRVAQGSAKFAVEAEGELRVAQASAKFATESGSAARLRVAQAVAKFAVRTYPIQQVAKTFPPVNLTVSKAPFVRWTVRQR